MYYISPVKELYDIGDAVASRQYGQAAIMGGLMFLPVNVPSLKQLKILKNNGCFPNQKAGKYVFRYDIDAVDGTLSITNMRTHHNGGTPAPMDFVITSKGELRLGAGHQYLAGGDDIIGAGQVVIVNGKVTKVTGRTGHYTPSDGKGGYLDNSQSVKDYKSFFIESGLADPNITAHKEKITDPILK